VGFASRWIENSRAYAYARRTTDDPAPFVKTRSYESVVEIASKLPDATFVSIVPRSGHPHVLLEDAPFDAVKNAFALKSAPASRALIVGLGGKGYDDTFSSALRLVWASTGVLKKRGELLLLAECSGGLGSQALEMVVTGRLSDEPPKKKTEYVEGLEEVGYLSKLREEFGVILLSGLPDLYARTKLGLGTAKGSGEAVGKLLSKIGRNTKVNVVVRAAETLLSEG
jgi:hypothetical protein